MELLQHFLRVFFFFSQYVLTNIYKIKTSRQVDVTEYHTLFFSGLES